jgi:hypothetical protein
MNAGLGQLEVLVPALSAAIQAGGQLGAAAITASATKTVAKTDEQAQVLQAIQQANTQLAIAKIQAAAGQQVTGGPNAPTTPTTFASTFSQSPLGMVVISVVAAKIAEMI